MASSFDKAGAILQWIIATKRSSFAIRTITIRLRTRGLMDLLDVQKVITGGGFPMTFACAGGDLVAWWYGPGEITIRFFGDPTEFPVTLARLIEITESRTDWFI